ncbi:hypothetical protein MAPG_11329, partial [Magnaporthiopsis poae ATCC 64411]
LGDLPKDLPSTFSRILQKSESLGKDYQQKTLKLVIAARHPLTTDELREALSVNPGNTDWNPAQLLNDVYSALACCGSLVTVDEEDFTVRLVHHSVKQFLLGGLESSSGGMFTLGSAMATMGHIIITYLNYGVFDNQLSTSVAPQIMAATAPRKIIQSAVGTSTSARVQELALRLLESHKRSEHNIVRTTQISSISSLTRNRIGFIISGTSQKRNRMMGWTPLQWAAENGLETVARLLLDRGADKDAGDGSSSTPLHRATKNGHEAVTRLLVQAGADKNAKDGYGRTPLHWAAENGHEAVARLLVQAGADKNAKDSDGADAAALGPRRTGTRPVARLLVRAGADKEAKNNSGRTPLHCGRG